MKITKHWLDGIKQVPTKNNAGVFLAPPTLLVMHYTASGLGIEADAKFFADQSQTSASAHLLLGEDGSLIQCVPFNKIAHHAGTSSWRGRAGCNNFSIGIEIDNWGLLKKLEDGTIRSWTGVKVDMSRVLKARHKNGSDEAYWYTYPAEQLRKLEEVTTAILRAYPSIKEVVGHDDIAPGRKTDPGPAFPMRRFQCLAEDRGADEPSFPYAITLAGKLNVRSGPGIHFPTIHDTVGPLVQGTRVRVIVDGPEWDQIQVEGKTGWVASQYLKPTT